MSKTLIIAKRELTSLFYSPVAYVALIVFAVIASVFFLFMTFAPGQPAELRHPFTWMVWLLVFVVPAISMGLLAEEGKTGTIEMLMTAPVSEVNVVLGKWLGAMSFFLTLLIPLVVFAIVLEITADPDWGPILSGLLGMVLVGGLYLAIGLMFSASTRNQLVAWLLTFLLTGFLAIGLYLLARTDAIPSWARNAMYYANVTEQYQEFAQGLVDTSNFVFFLSGIALFLFFAVMILQSRRWR